MVSVGERGRENVETDSYGYDMQCIVKYILQHLLIT